MITPFFKQAPILFLQKGEVSDYFCFTENLTCSRMFYSRFPWQMQEQYLILFFLKQEQYSKINLFFISGIIMG